MTKKVKVQLEQISEFRGSPPEVPLAEGVNYEELVAKDIADGQEPMFVTLPLAQFGQVSRNKRRYPEAEIRRMYNRIIQSAVTGDLGHMKIEDRSTKFEVPAVKWVGAAIVEDELYGKLYVLSHRKDVREYMRVQKASNGRVGTSLYALAYEEYNEEDDVYEISGIELEQIDIVHPDRVGVLMAAMNSPHITIETIQEAEPGEIAVGDFVQWERNGNLVRGQVNTVWTEGEVEVPYSDSPDLTATDDNPIARMDVFEPNYHGKGWILTSWQLIQYVNDLTKIKPLELAESEQVPNSEDLSRTTSEEDAGAAGENITEEVNNEEEAEMSKTPQADTDTRIVELQEAHQEQIRVLNLEKTELKKNARTFQRLCEMLSVAEGDDPVLALQALKSDYEVAQKENSDLLTTAIESEVSKHVAVEWARGIVIESVTKAHPQTRAEVVQVVQECLKNENVKRILKNAIQKESGPALTTPTETPAPDATDEGLILIPEMED